VAVDVAAGSRVRRGAIVLHLDPSLLRAEYNRSLAQARQSAGRLQELENGNVPADVARARQQSAAAEAEYRQAIAQSGPQAAAQGAAVHEAEATLVLARSALERTESLFATGDVSRQSLDE